MYHQQPKELSDFVVTLRQAIWSFGVVAWLFGITDRSIASLADGYLSALDIMQLFTAAVFFLSWLYLKPTPRVSKEDYS